jgi:dipeptidyl-peptidase-4
MGWSYGGYLSLMCLAKGNGIFKTAISIAPVSNWLWYNDVIQKDI